jgi:hypothetical protein
VEVVSKTWHHERLMTSWERTHLSPPNQQIRHGSENFLVHKRTIAVRDLAYFEDTGASVAGYFVLSHELLNASGGLLRRPTAMAMALTQAD